MTKKSTNKSFVGQKKTGVNRDQTKLSARFLKFLKWLLLVLIFLFLILVASQPLRGKAAQKYLDAGDNYLTQKQYLRADLEYQKALILTPKNNEAKQRRVFVKNTAGDILQIKNFSGGVNFDQLIEKIDLATDFPGDETAAVRLSKQFIEEKEYQLAILPAKTATEMDPDYIDAWAYLGIANLKAATLIQLWPDVKEKYLLDSQIAFSKIRELDPTYKIPAEWTSY